MIPSNDIIFFFEGLNCCHKIHNLLDVQSWLDLDVSLYEDTILDERVRNYERYYAGQSIDPQGSTPYCEWRCRKVSKETTHTKEPKRPKRIKVRK